MTSNQALMLLVAIAMIALIVAFMLIFRYFDRLITELMMNERELYGRIQSPDSLSYARSERIRNESEHSLPQMEPQEPAYGLETTDEIDPEELIQRERLRNDIARAQEHFAGL